MLKLVDEEQEQRTDRAAEYYYSKYQPQMEALEKYSPLAAIRRVNTSDFVALGEQLEQFQRYAQFMSEAGTLNDLGVLPRVALDIITATYGASIVPLIASIQPIEEEQGTIYYKTTKATTTRGNVTVGQTFRTGQPGVQDVYPRQYAGEKITKTASSQTAASVLQYSGTEITETPVRPRTVRITIPDLDLTATDDGEGNLVGVKVWGTIQYEASGSPPAAAWTLNLVEDPAGTHDILLEYATDFEASGVIPQISMVTESTDIKAEIFVLGSEIGMFKVFAMKKRFGKIAEEEMVNDLTQEITAEIGNELLYRMVNAPTWGAGNSLTWDRSANAGNYGYSEHKNELKSKLFELDGLIRTNAGRGMANVFVAGDIACSVLADLPGFVGQNMGAVGPNVFGTLDGKPVIRAPQPWINTRHIYAIYKGTGRFDAAAVYSPFMPLWVVGTLQTPNNVLKKSGVAAVWAGMKVVGQEFIARIEITN